MKCSSRPDEEVAAQSGLLVTGKGGLIKIDSVEGTCSEWNSGGTFRDSRLKEISEAAAALPANFSWNVADGPCKAHVRNQGTCGSCW